MKKSRKTTLGLVLRSALKGNLEDGWIYFRDSSIPRADTECLVVAEWDSELTSEEIASELGFNQEGLDTQTIEDTAKCAAQFFSPPSDDLLVESFVYYWRFDAWLPNPGAPEPPPPDVALAIEARQFYDSLGFERIDCRCKSPGCTRGAVKLSVYCRPHHFQMVRKCPCPFDH